MQVDDWAKQDSKQQSPQACMFPGYNLACQGQASNLRLLWAVCLLLPLLGAHVILTVCGLSWLLSTSINKGLKWCPQNCWNVRQQIWEALKGGHKNPGYHWISFLLGQPTKNPGHLNPAAPRLLLAVEARPNASAVQSRSPWESRCQAQRRPRSTAMGSGALQGGPLGSPVSIVSIAQVNYGVW